MIGECVFLIRTPIRSELTAFKTARMHIGDTGTRELECFCGFGLCACCGSQSKHADGKMLALKKFIDQEGLTQADASKRLKVTQPRISDLNRGKLSRFSLDKLVSMVTHAGLEVELRVRGGRRVAKRA